MGEAWLDSLSEDWNSQPESPSSAVASTQNSRSGSRIPRIKREQYGRSLRTTSAAHRTPSVSFSKPRRALSERSNSDINIPLSPSLTPNEPKRSSDVSHTLSKSTSSVGSVVKHSIDTRPLDTNGTNTFEDSHDLDWKKMVMAGVVNAQRRDLFAPMELENIFQEPHHLAGDGNADLDSSLFARQESDYVPSSPPPWPRSRKDKYVEELSFSRPPKTRALAVVQELDESEANPDHNSKLHEDSVINKTYASPHGYPQSAEGTRDGSGTAEAENTLPVIPPRTLDQTSQKHGAALPAGENKIATYPERGHQLTSATSEVVPSSSTGFSPVLIYKNATVDGQVQYTPFVKKKVDLIHRKASRSSSPVLGRKATNDRSPHDLPELGNNVLVRRGIGSDEISFQRRPLSPSMSSSLLPSDSISHAHYYTNRNPPPVVQQREVELELDQGDDRNRNASSSISKQSTLLRSRSVNGGTASRSQSVPRMQIHRVDEIDVTNEAQHEPNKSPLQSKKDRVDEEEDERTMSFRPKDFRQSNDGSSTNPGLGLSGSPHISQGLAEGTSNVEELNKVKEDIEAVDLHGDEREVSEIKAIASEVATVRVNAQMRSTNTRKPSVCTQDYLDEAMKIMEFIRSKRAPQIELSSLIESAAEAVTQFGEQTSPTNLERPPSREGKVSNWRTNHTQYLDSKTLAHLKMYQETDDETFLQSSAAHDLDREEMDNLHELVSSVPPSPVRAIEHHNSKEEEEEEEESEDQSECPSPQTSPIRTHSSHASMDSNGRTISTNSSSKTRTLPTISPDKVAHLIPAEQAGMRFDSERRSWVKCRSKEKCADTNPLSTPLSEDDPFSQIPDLSISHNSEDDFVDESESRASFANSREQHRRGNSQPEPASDDNESVVDLQRDSNDLQPAENIGDLSLISLRPPETPASIRNNSQHHLNHLSSAQRRGLRYGSPGWLHSEPNLSMSRIDEHHEVSLVQTRPDGRTTSFTVSVSTPLPAHRRFSMPVLRSSAVRRNRVLEPLSDLSDFTVDQDDSRHLVSRNLQRKQRQQQQLLHPRPGDGSALVTNELVEKLTDVEPDEPYWDWLHALDLKDKNLQSLHMLDEFCPRLEELEVSGNRLQHLGGAPVSLRQLNVRFNHVSSISNWNHLSNLQYLDLTGNMLTTLDGLSSLVHLRGLIADSNHIKDLKGVLDLNGLLSLSLKDNKLEKVDFDGSELLRLRELDISGNNVEVVDGLHFLPELRHMDASSNKIWRFPYSDADREEVSNLQTLRISNNIIEYLDVSSLTALETLDADYNRLSYIKSITEVDNLHTLALRSQTPVAGTADLASSLNDFNEIRHLYLSGNTMQKLAITTSFLNLQTLELAHTGLQSLPYGFGHLAPNLRTLNLNFNALKSIRQLKGAEKLKQLYVAGNRLARLRKTAASLRQHKMLQDLDLRDNPLTLRFYPPLTSGIAETQLARAGHLAAKDTSLQQRGHSLLHTYGTGAAGKDDEYFGRLDDETKLKRKVYEVLLVAQCRGLGTLDGLSTHHQPVFETGSAWDKLVGAGIVEELTGALPVATGNDLD